MLNEDFEEFVLRSTLHPPDIANVGLRGKYSKLDNIHSTYFKCTCRKPLPLLKYVIGLLIDKNVENL